MEQDIISNGLGKKILWTQCLPSLLFFILLAVTPFSTPAQGVISSSSTTGANLDSLFAPPTNSVTINPGITLDNSSGGSHAVSGSSRFWNITNAATLHGNGTSVNFGSGGSVNNLSNGSILGGGDGVLITGGEGAVVNAGSITGTLGQGIQMASGGSVNNLAGGVIIGNTSHYRGGEDGILISHATGAVTNAGTIIGYNGRGVELDSGGGVNNLSGGTISGGDVGVLILVGGGSVNNGVNATISGALGVSVGGSGNQRSFVENAGSIIGTNDSGVVMGGAGGSLINLAGGIITGKANQGVAIFGGAGSVDNAGSITGDYTGVYLNVGGSVNNLSGGTITANGNAGVEIYGASGSVTNAGSIIGHDAVGVKLDFTGNLINLPGGTIAGDMDGAELSYYAGTGYVANAGSIVGFGSTGAYLGSDGSVNNDASGIIAGITNGISIAGNGNVINTGLITGTNNAGLYLGKGGNVNNLSGGTIEGGSYGVNISGGPGSVYNAGSIIGSNGTAVFLGSSSFSNKITLDTGSVVQGNIVGNGGADAAFLQGSGEYGDNFTNFATLTMGPNNQGGNWNLTGTNTFAQSATVQSGLLRVNGEMNSPLVSVTNVSGGLGGSGVIYGTVDNHGYFAPGNSIGTLTINGSVTNWGDYYVEVNATGNSDSIAVNGTTTINGGNVVVQPAAGIYARQSSYTILTATNGISGTYIASSIVLSNTPQSVLFPITSSLLRYDPNDVYLIVNRTPFASVAWTFNQNAIANALDGISLTSSSPAMTNLVSQFYWLSSVSRAQAALDSLSGEIHGTLGLLDVQQQDDFNNSIARRTGRISANGRSGEFATSWKPVQLASAGSELPPMRLQQAEVQPPLDFWLQGIGSFGQLASDGNAQGGNYTISGLSGGADYRLAPELLAGLGLGYSHDNADVGGPGANGTVDAYQIGGYGGYVRGPWHLDCILSGGCFQTDTKRFINVGGIQQQASGSYDGGVFSLSTEGGYTFKFDWLTAEPALGLNYAHLWQNSFDETGSASDGNNYGLHVNDVGMDSVRSILGARLAAQFGGKDGVQFLPALHALWEHEFADRCADVNASFVGGGSAFDVRGVELGADTALLGGGLTVAFNRTVHGFINYDASLNSQLTSSTVSGGLSVSW